MIKVKRTEGDSVSKIVGRFVRRVKLSNLVARARKTRYYLKPPSKLAQKRKAIRRYSYQQMEDFLIRTGKK